MTELKSAGPYELTRYREPGQQVSELTKTHVPFSGSPLRHPYDQEKLILVVDPYSTSRSYYEFSKDDITYAEKLPNLSSADGDTIAITRLWVRKGSMAVRSTPFIVEETL